MEYDKATPLTNPYEAPGQPDMLYAPDEIVPVGLDAALYSDPGIFPDQEVLDQAITDDSYLIDDREAPPETDGTPYFIVPDPDANRTSWKEVFEGQIRTQAPHALTHLALLRSGELNVDEGVVIRTFPAEHHEVPTLTPADAERYIATTIEHWGVLTDTGGQPGIVIANTFFQTEEHLDTEGRPDGTAYIRSIVERVNSNAISVRQWTCGGLGSPKEIEAATALATTLTNYLAWVADTNQPSFLKDVFAAHQYSINADGRPVLADTDPYITSFDTKDGWVAFGDAVKDVQKTANALAAEGLHTVADPLLDELKRLELVYLLAEITTVPNLPSVMDRKASHPQ